MYTKSIHKVPRYKMSGQKIISSYKDLAFRSRQTTHMTQCGIILQIAADLHC